MLKTRSIVSAFLLVTALGVLNEACVSHDFPSFTCPDEPVSFAQDVHPIITSKCAITDCHGSNPDIPNWNDFATFQEGARDGNVRNYVLNRIMPPDGSPQGPLSQEEINKIVCWTDQGAQHN